MQIPRRHGREFLYTNLQHVEPLLRNETIRHIFERNDYFYESNVKPNYVSPQWQATLRKTCGQFADSATEFLDHLIKDTRLAKRVRKWGLSNLEDVLALIEFLKSCCGACKELVSSLEKYCEELDTEQGAEQGTEQGTEQGSIVNTKGKKKNKKKMPAATFTVKGEKQKSYQETLRELKEIQQKVNIEIMALLKHLRSGSLGVTSDEVDNLVENISVGKTTKIPAATLRELFILNEAYLKREKLWSQMKGWKLWSQKEDKPSAQGGDHDISHLSVGVQNILGRLTRIHCSSCG